MDKYIGTRLSGRYQIEEIIGIGGMANVYKAKDLAQNMVVAVKILKDEFRSNGEFIRRFKNESKAISLLDHPNIVKVYDVDFTDAVDYIVMEYIDGITLKEYIQQKGKLAWKDAVFFTEQILNALEHAHDRGIVHRDIKPQNVMLLHDGTLKMMDFGIARFARSENRTITDKAIGSVHYISPEQARGDDTDSKADLYSTGVILFEMLTGQLPFEADTAVSVAIKQISDKPVSPSEINPDIPEGLEEITLKAMQKEVGKRYQSAGEMLDDIEAFKKNPSISFQYKYFVDNDPTKYIDAIEQVKEETAEQDVVVSSKRDNGKGKKKKKTSKLVILGGVAAAFVVASILLLVGMSVFNFGFFGNNISAPSVLGLTVEDAQEKYPDIKIVEDGEVFSDKYEKGLIAEQSHKTGERIKKGGELTVKISLGPEVLKIPEVVGQEKTSAENTLTKLGLKVHIETEASTEVPANYVISVDPNEGTEVEVGQTVTLVVSEGNTSDDDIVPVPKLVNLASRQAAEAALKSVGLELGTVTEEESDSPVGSVIKQSVPSGDQVAKGTKVNITISKGKASVSEAKVSIGLPSATGSFHIDVRYNNRSIYNNAAYGASASRNLSLTVSLAAATDVEVYINDSLYRVYRINLQTGGVTIYSDYSGSDDFKNL